MSRPGFPDREAALSRRTTDGLIAEELRRLDPDEVYGETLDAVAALSGSDAPRTTPRKPTEPAKAAKATTAATTRPATPRTGTTGKSAKPAAGTASGSTRAPRRRAGS
jgi:hypothetical protein